MNEWYNAVQYFALTMSPVGVDRDRANLAIIATMIHWGG